MTNLKNLRLKKEYTQCDLAQFMQVGSSVVARWELGHTAPTLVQTIKLCCLLGCKVAELFRDEDFFAEEGIPLFDCEGHCCSFVPSDGCSADASADFAVTLWNDVSCQLKKGDICCFSLSQQPLSHSVVLCTGDGYSSRIVPCSSCTDDERVVAVCTAVRCMI